MCILADACCVVYFVKYISALHRVGEADVKRELDYSSFFLK